MWRLFQCVVFSFVRGGPALPRELVNFLNRHKGETWKAHIYFPPQSLGKFKSYLSILKAAPELNKNHTNCCRKISTNVPFNLYIIGRFCLFVCLSRKMITLSNGLKSSSLAVEISFFKHCNKKMFSMNCTCQQKIV